MLILKIIVPINNIKKLFYKTKYIKNIEIGSRVLVPLKKRKIIGIITKIYNKKKIKNIKFKKIIKIIDKKFLLNKYIYKLIYFTSKYYHYSIKKLIFKLIPRNKKLTISKFIKQQKKTKKKNKKSKILLLTKYKKSIKIKFIIKIIKKYINNNLQILILTPNIKILHKIYNILYKIYNKINIIHSKINKKIIINIWEQTKKNKIYIIIGTRSAVFTPFNNLGLIIIFEEHNKLYNEYKTCTYNAKNLSIIRSKIEKSNIILESNNPSIKTLYYIKKKIYKVIKIKKQKKFKLKNKINIFNKKNKINIINKIIKNIKNKKKILIITNKIFNKYKIKCNNCKINKIKCKYCNNKLNILNKYKNKCIYCKRFNITKKICYKCNNSLKIKKNKFYKYVKKNFSNIFNKNNNIKFKKFIKISNNLNNYNKNIKIIIINNIDEYLISENYKSIEIFIQKYFIFLEKNYNIEKKIIFITKYPNHYIFKQIKHKNYQQIILDIIKERKIIKYPPYSYECIIRFEENKNFLKLWKNIKYIFKKYKNIIINNFSKNKNHYFYKYKWNLIIHSKLQKYLHIFIKKIIINIKIYNIKYLIEIN